MIKQLICKECGSPRKIGRRLCTQCNSQRVIKNNLKNRGTVRCYSIVVCEACKQPAKACRNTQRFCSSCWVRRAELAKAAGSNNEYVYVAVANREKEENAWAHRRLAECVLIRKLNSHEVVHHMDNNPKNNLISNLVVLLRKDHIKLHKFLDDQRVILEKSGNVNLGNCWNNLIIPMTTAWLETTSAKVIKLWELGQSAAEPLSNEEGSETSAPGTLTVNAEGDDTVQTTTT